MGSIESMLNRFSPDYVRTLHMRRAEAYAVATQRFGRFTVKKEKRED
jgi:hypothetical protein